MEPLLPKHYYHIYNHANGDELLFKNIRNYDFFLQKYLRFVEPVANTLAYCLMPNHFHFLVKIRDETEIEKVLSGRIALKYYRTDRDTDVMTDFVSKQFSNLFSSYTQSYNKLYDRMGSLYMKNFKRRIADEPSYRKELIIYIHLNPVKHGFVNLPEDWNYSSYNTFLSNKSTFLNRKEINLMFESMDEFRECHLLI